MKIPTLLIAILMPAMVFAQKHIPLPHGMVYGQKPDTIAMMPANKLEEFMGKKTRISTTIEGKIIKVTKEKGGWFDVDAGGGKIMAAHFKNYNVILPAQLAGRTVIMEGVAEKMFIADDLQHLAGDTVSGKKQHKVKTDPKRAVTFEVKGLMVDK
ncbi:DUF4920 domain-containing protein [Mucilaginibacter ginsenosidivorax]|uniref:DUF4920 domain-containing protein n=1 Tax=Mucilaginibacter ginsenosidivorax TaxID=862126 RepID=A0A5B8W112_9SPHI|nr:DUF4920 domain-containing protein [Mucilaginibacter ginsenosidivorax]QEC77363.1 DUF4920 domain-containing protein [Mucilaginibacter ginsenosidivorax]